MIDPNTLTKRYYKIGEVAKMFNVATSLIRYWEGEFDELNPKKNNKGVRRFLKEDVLVVSRIYDLVKVKGYKLEGAKLAIKEKEQSPIFNQSESNNSQAPLIQLKEELEEIKNNLLQLKSVLKEDQKSEEESID